MAQEYFKNAGILKKGMKNPWYDNRAKGNGDPI